MTLNIDVKPSTSTVSGISAMKQALEALEQIHPGNMTPMAEEAWNKSIAALRQAIAEAEKQEPAMWMEDSEGNKYPLPKQKEDWYGQHQWQCGYERGWDKGYEAGWDNRGEEEKNNWVGLTDEERHELNNFRGLMPFIHAIEAKLKEKNA